MKRSKIIISIFSIFSFSCLKNGAKEVADTMADSAVAITKSPEISDSVSRKQYSLKDLFVMSPDHFTNDLSKDEKLQLIENFGNQEATVGKNFYSLDVYDVANGFLSYTFVEGWTEFCYWNLGNRQKVIASGTGGCGPLCEYDLDFLIFDDGDFQPIEKSKVLPKVTFQDFFKTDEMLSDNVNVQKWENEFDGFELIYALPRKGKNIIVVSQFNNFASFDEDTIKLYAKGTKMELEWIVGSFVKGRVY